MSLVTRCPRCQRAFQVVLDQLRLHEGLVRCGGCSMVFDGFDCLETSLPTLTRLASDSAPAVNAPAHQPAVAAGSVSAPSATTSGAGPGLSPAPAAPSASVASGVVNDIPRWTSPAAALARATPQTPVNPAAPAIPAAPTSNAIFAGTAVPANSANSAPPAIHATPVAPIAAATPAAPVTPATRSSVAINPEAPIYPSPPLGVATTPMIDGADTQGAGPAVMRRRLTEKPGDRDQEPSLSSLNLYADEPDEFEHDSDRNPDRNPVMTVLGESRLRGPGAASVGRSEPEFLVEEEPASVFTGLLWGLASIVALVLLLGQLVYVYRNELATFSPSLRIVISGVCARIGCDVNFVRHLDKITIDSSSLQQVGGAPQEGQPSELLLSLSMRNRLDRAQSWPSLRLELKDASGTVVVRKDIAPHQYLPSTLIDQPFAPGQEVNLTLPLTVGAGLIINGFQLRVFFP